MNGNKMIGGFEVLDARTLSRLQPVTAIRNAQRYPLYSILDVPAGGGSVTQLPFFSTPQGGSQTVGGTALTMDLTRTNITKANAISTPNAYLLKAIRLWVCPDAGTYTWVLADVTDMMLALGEGYYKMTFGEREYLYVAPPLMLSSGMGLEGFGGGYTNTDVIVPSNSHPLIYKVEPYVQIPSELNFQVTLNYTTALAQTAKLRVGVIFDGELYRNAQ